ncbi:hypothetical protein PPROV_000233700 [Pycnococcus provasolii]|uniref:Phospholipid/glycerol acyltransferase domain-containing protein n=1 Tax=Pycnococcus provasolii TaxID=41880 RepID=A0A830HAB5_9CHLO|nr:hypothetical protein PPROV_000233700 [Pycnococcus provasolii]
MPSSSASSSMRCALHASPFLETNFPMNMYERAKIALMILSAPVRIVIFVVAFATAFAHFYAATAGADLNKPLATWRRKIVFGAAMWCRIVLVPLGFLYINTKGFENYTPDMRSGKKRIVICINHVSWVDSFLLVIFFQPCSVTKKTIANLPLIGRGVRAFQPVLVDRVEAASAGADATNVGAKAGNKAALVVERIFDDRYPNIAMAPEGTTTNGRTVVRFKRGAFVAGVPVLPVVIRYPCKNYNIAWTLRDDNFAFLRLASQLYNRCEVKIMPLYTPSEAERADAGLYATNMQRLFANELGEKPSDQDLTTQFQLMYHGVQVRNDGVTIDAPEDFVKNGYPYDAPQPHLPPSSSPTRVYHAKSNEEDSSARLRRQVGAARAA